MTTTNQEDFAFQFSNSAPELESNYNTEFGYSILTLAEAIELCKEVGESGKLFEITEEPDTDSNRLRYTIDSLGNWFAK